MLKKTIRAGALQYVLVVAVIIAILIFAFLSLHFLQQKISVKQHFLKETIYNVENGFDYLKRAKIGYDAPVQIDISENHLEATTIVKKHWGIYDLAIIRSQIKNEFYQKAALLGAQTNNKAAVYLKENYQSLVLVGNTKITGNVLVPKLGVKTGNIAGVSFYGNQLIMGNQQLSANTLPEIKNIASLRSFYDNFGAVDFDEFDLVYNTRVFKSFTEKMLVYERLKAIVLEDLSLSGHILIASSTKITVKASANLSDVILMAPKIVIEENTKGNFQAIATQNIQVQSRCLLSYPTALVLLEKEVLSNHQEVGNRQGENRAPENQLSIAKGSEVKGVVVFDSTRKETNYKAQMSLEAQAIVTGEIYCAKNLEMRGTVIGAVITSNFIVQQSGGIYRNHLYNAVINVNKLPKQYAGLQLENQSNAVAKWVR